MVLEQMYRDRRSVTVSSKALLVTSDLLGYWVLGGWGVVEVLKSLRTSVTRILNDLSPMEQNAQVDLSSNYHCNL